MDSRGQGLGPPRHTSGSSCSQIPATHSASRDMWPSIFYSITSYHTGWVYAGCAWPPCRRRCAVSADGGATGRCVVPRGLPQSSVRGLFYLCRDDPASAVGSRAFFSAPVRCRPHDLLSDFGSRASVSGLSSFVSFATGVGRLNLASQGSGNGIAGGGYESGVAHIEYVEQKFGLRTGVAFQGMSRLPVARGRQELGNQDQRDMLYAWQVVSRSVSGSCLGSVLFACLMQASPGLRRVCLATICIMQASPGFRRVSRSLTTVPDRVDRAVRFPPSWEKLHLCGVCQARLRAHNSDRSFSPAERYACSRHGIL